MDKLICSKCMKVFDQSDHGKCPRCHHGPPHVYDFKNSDDYLKERIPLVLEERKRLGFDGLVGGLECTIINTEPDQQKAAVEELLRYTGLRFTQAFQDPNYRTCLLKAPGSADFLVRSRTGNHNPFAPFNTFPRSRHLSNTRLETFVFGTKDIEEYSAVQKSRRVNFITDEALRSKNYCFIQTIPSRLTGNSIGFIQWKDEPSDYATEESEALDWRMEKPEKDHLKSMGRLDHTATRVKAEDRDSAIIEFMELTNYSFDFAIYVKLFNSITDVARLSAEDFTMVFTSGIALYVSDEVSGPTEKFIHNYGTRVHHMAFQSEKIEQTFSALKEDGLGFLIDLVGSPQEDLKQTFSEQSQHTLLVNE